MSSLSGIRRASRVGVLTARRVGEDDPAMDRRHIPGWEDGQRKDLPAGRPKVLLRTYAAAFFVGFAAPFAAFMLFSLAENSCLTLAVIASVSTL